MRKYIEHKLIEYVASTEIGDNIPSIMKMSKELYCSRGILQRVIKEFEQNQYIKLLKTQSGTKLLSIDYAALANIYFESIAVSLTLYTNSIINDNLTERVLSTFAELNCDTYIIFSDSSLHRLELLFQNNVHFALVTDAYYKTLDIINVSIYKRYELATNISTKLVISDKPNLAYNVDEIPAQSIENSSNVNHPKTYYLICQNHVANLLPYKDK